MQGNYDPHTGFLDVSQNRDDYDLSRVISDKEGTFVYKHIEEKYEVIGKWINGRWIARRVEF